MLFSLSSLFLSFLSFPFPSLFPERAATASYLHESKLAAYAGPLPETPGAEGERGPVLGALVAGEEPRGIKGLRVWVARPGAPQIVAAVQRRKEANHCFERGWKREEGK